MFWTNVATVPFRRNHGQIHCFTDHRLSACLEICYKFPEIDCLMFSLASCARKQSPGPDGVQTEKSILSSNTCDRVNPLGFHWRFFCDSLLHSASWSLDSQKGHCDIATNCFLNARITYYYFSVSDEGGGGGVVVCVLRPFLKIVVGMGELGIQLVTFSLKCFESTKDLMPYF